MRAIEERIALAIAAAAGPACDGGRGGGGTAGGGAADGGAPPAPYAAGAEPVGPDGNCLETVVDRATVIDASPETACKLARAKYIADPARADACRGACGDPAVTTCDVGDTYWLEYVTAVAGGPDTCPDVDAGSVDVECDVTHVVETSYPPPCGNGRRPAGFDAPRPRGGTLAAWLEANVALAAPAPAPAPAPASALVVLARENASEGIVRETYGAAVLALAATRARDASLRGALASIAADERAHAALSFRVAAWANGRLDAEGRASVDAAIHASLAALRAEIGDDTTPRAVRDAAGLPTRAEALAVLARLEQSVVLDALAIRAAGTVAARGRPMARASSASRPRRAG